MKKNKPALKPCPCCGSEVELSEGYDETDHYICWIECPNCHLSTRLCDSPPSALWNSRPIVSGDGLMIKLEKRVYDVLLKRNADLMDENDHLREALEFYASGQHIDSASFGSSYSIRIEDGTKAKEALKECGL